MLFLEGCGSRGLQKQFLTQALPHGAAACLS